MGFAMPSIWASRLYFAVIAVLAVAAFASGTACTRWGQPGPVPPTIAPLSTLYVNPNTGSDTSGNGSLSKPYKTLTKAIEVLASAKRLASSGVTIKLASGDYDATKGEKFPIVVPTDVTIVGTNFGSGPGGGRSSTVSARIRFLKRPFERRRAAPIRRSRSLRAWLST